MTNLEEEDVFPLHFQVTDHYVKQGQEPETKTKQRPLRKDVYWLVPHGLLSLLSCKTQDHQPRVGTTHSGAGHPPHQSSVKKTPDKQARWQSEGGNSLVEAFLFPGNSILIKLTRLTSTDFFSPKTTCEAGGQPCKLSQKSGVMGFGASFPSQNLL